MTNKIVILDDSVILYEHYISDDKWERTLAFPRGGLTYLLSNGTIKFYAYEDYFYRNCIISMQLPIYIVDEYMHIDGEYDNIKDLTDVLDRIFPTNDIDAQLEKYLKIVDAELLYQPIGDYALKSDIPDVSDFVTTEELVEALDDYYTKEESDAKYQLKGDYATKDELELKADKDDVYTKTESDNKYQLKGYYLTSADTYVKNEIDDKLGNKLDASAYTPTDLSNYYTKQETSSKTQIDTALERKADNDKVYTKSESDARFQPNGDYLTTADTYVKSDIDDKLGKKLDASAYTPCDLSNYYTKQEVDTGLESKADVVNVYSKSDSDAKYQVKLVAGTNITISGNVISAAGGSGGTVDAYTKAESDARFQQKGNYITEIDLENELDKYVTKTWITNQNYVTNNTFNTHITNLQEQINSLQEALEKCCSGTPTPTVEYRWITLTSSSDYLCVGTTKYEKQQKQQSTDGGITWTNVVPSEYQRGQIIETSSVDCGAAPEITDRRWVEMPDEYMCLDKPTQYCKYKVLKLQWSYDNGVTWVDSNPLKTTEGSLINCYNVDCGYVEPQYRWTVAPNEYLCSGTSKYDKEYYEVSYDSGTTWERVVPEETRRGNLIETMSEDCGFVDGTKFSALYSDGTSYSAQCDDNTSIGGSVTRAHSTSFTAMTNAAIGPCITTVGEDAFSGFTSLSAVTLDSNTNGIANHAFADCSNLKSINLQNIEYIDYSAFYYCTKLENVTMKKVKALDDGSFRKCTNLKNVYIEGTIRSIGSHVFFGCTNLESLTVNSKTPPGVGRSILYGADKCIIHVPRNSVNRYKTASGWSEYADRITSI